MQGLHLTADLLGCRCDSVWLTDADRLAARCEAAVQQAGLSAVAKLAHTFPASDAGPGGVTATVLLAESHLCVHTWPEIGAATLDVYVCNYRADHSVRAEALMASLLALFDAAQVERRAIERGAIGLVTESP